MDRRDLLKLIAILTGGTVVGAEAFLSGCTSADKKSSAMTLTAEDIPYLDEIAETILPATKTPGAKAAKVGEFMTRIVNDCYDEKDQKLFHDGMDNLNAACKKAHGHTFLEATPQQRHELLVGLDKELKTYREERKNFNQTQDIKEKEAMAKGDTAYKKEVMPDHANQYYNLFKQLTLWGYFTSKEGITQALRYLPVPGKFEACVDYKKGDKLMAGLDG